jgi:hypothetical protein
MTHEMQEHHQNNIIAAQLVCEYIHRSCGEISQPVKQLAALDVFRALLNTTPDEVLTYVQNNIEMQQIFGLGKVPTSRDIARQGLRVRRQRPKLVNEIRSYLSKHQPPIKVTGIG